MRFLSFDLECVLDADAGRRVYGFAGTDREVREQMRQKKLADSQGRSDFPAPGFWQIVAVGVVGFDSSKGRASVAGRASETEGDLIGHLAGLIALMNHPQLVGWNSGSYDLSVLRYRAIRHGLDLSGLYGPADQRQYDSYLYRYGERHLDLSDVLSGYGASHQMKLVEVAGLAGLTCKTAGSGKEVEDLFEAGDLPALERYVTEDAAITALLFLRWQLTRGRVSREWFNKALDLLGGEVAETYPQMARDIGGWRREHLQLVEATA